MKQHIQKPKKNPALFLTLLSLIIMVFGILAGRSVVQNTTTVDSQAKTSTQTGNQIRTQSNTINVVKVYYVKYIPKYDATRSIIQKYNWNDPDTLANQYISEVSNFSNGRITYQIVESKVIEDFTTLQNGHHYTMQEFEDCYANKTCVGIVDNPGETVNYNKIITDTQACEKRNSGEIDELWINGPPYSGWWETIMTGPGAYDNQTTPVQNTTCQKPMFIMGYNYERGITEFVHNLTHRTNNALNKYVAEKAAVSDHSWNKFLINGHDHPDASVFGCGAPHFGPNSTANSPHYTYSLTRQVTSNCDDWINYPNTTPSQKTIDCSSWGCTELGFSRYWFSHVPHADGTDASGILNNWWKYVVYGKEGPPVPTNTPILSPTVTPPGGGGGGGLSNSKLGIFMIGNYSAGAQQIVAAGPRVIKVMDPQSNPSLMDAVREYKQKFPDGTVIMRVYVSQSVQYGLDKNPEEAASDFWELHVKPEVNKLSASDKQLIDYLNGPNYQENFMANKLESDEELTWYSRFWTKYIDLVAGYGMKTNMGEIYVAGLDKVHIPKIIGALQKLKEKNGIWSYHGYTIQYTMDPAIEKDYSLHYREFYDYLKQNNPDLADLKMALTEAGVDKGGNAATDGWQARGTAEKYQEWLKWFDTEMRKDSYIIGATLFQIGDSGWKSFNIEPIAPWLAQYLRGQGGSGQLPTATPRGGGGGGGGGRTTLRVEVWITRTGQTRRPWGARDGTAQVYIKGPTARGGDRFSVVMSVPTSSGVFQDTEGHYFRGEPGVILWAGAGTSAGDPGGGTTPGRYTTKLSVLPTGLGPLPYPNVYATISQGQTGVAILDVVEGNGPWPTIPPEPTVTPGGNPTPTGTAATPTTNPNPSNECRCNDPALCYPDKCSRNKLDNPELDCRATENLGPLPPQNSNHPLCKKAPDCCNAVVAKNDPYQCCWIERGFCTREQCAPFQGENTRCGWYWTHDSNYGCNVPAGNTGTSYTNEDYARVISQYAKGQLTALDVSRWISDATRSPGLQLTPCDPTTPGECEAR